MSVAPSTFPASTTPVSAFDPGWSLQDVQNHLGLIPLSRIRAVPAPGTVTEADFWRFVTEQNELCEWIDGVIVEKAVGNFQATVTARLIFFLELYLNQHDLGYLLTPDGKVRPKPNEILSPDISFVAWNRTPQRAIPDTLPFGPDLAVEVLSPANTTAEMDRKRRDLFAAGTRLMWLVEPELPSVVVYTAADEPPVILHERDTLTGGEVLPGFELSIREWFSRVSNTR